MTAAFPPPGVQVLTIGELTLAIKDLLESEHPSVWVQGEVSNLARPTSGHLYLTLKDEQSPLRAVIYRGVALRLKYDLRDGMQVVARGRISVYLPRGEYQLLIEEIRPKGIGALELAFRQLKEKLLMLGYFDPARKKPLPRIPGRICLITSPTGSAVRDVLEVLARRWPALEVWVFPVLVQGDAAAPQIAAALGYLNQVGNREGDTPIDAIVLVRGGGSLEDLWPFNEEIVAHAIFRSRVPVVTGIGHEDDLTIADLIADRRALTPSEAAERSVPNCLDVLAELEATRARLASLLRGRLELARMRLAQLAGRPCFQRPLEVIREREHRVDELSTRLHQAMQRHRERAGTRLESTAARLESLSPLNVLARGYSLTRKLDDLSVVRSPAQVSPGDWLVSEVKDGRLISRVEAVEPTRRN